MYNHFGIRPQCILPSRSAVTGAGASLMDDDDEDDDGSDTASQQSEVAARGRALARPRRGGVINHKDIATAHVNHK